MKRFSISLLCITMLGCAGISFPAEPILGVIAEERVINLPNDQAKWYVSVVGDANDAHYQKILGWFKTNEKLVNLKRQVHFCPITTGTAVYAERYAPNVKALPTIRLQRANGVVVYEVSGGDIPMSPEGLNGAMANSIRPILPWRRNHVHPQPKPVPDPAPPVDPDPQPIDDGGAPDFDGTSRGVPVGFCILAGILSALAGATIGVVVQWKKTYSEE